MSVFNASLLEPPEGGQHRAPEVALQITDVVPWTRIAKLWIKVDDCLLRDATSQLVSAATLKPAAHALPGATVHRLVVFPKLARPSAADPGNRVTLDKAACARRRRGGGGFLARGCSPFPKASIV
ncbi:hypothetical protein AAY473_038794 [Plecturocebus cupreus]